MEKPIPFTDYDFDVDAECPATTWDHETSDDFELDIAWIAAWEKRKKVRMFWCSRVLRRLKRKSPDTKSL